MSIVIVCFLFSSCRTKKTISENHVENPGFPEALNQFSPNSSNPIFTGTDENTWDKQIRERGYILHEDGIYKMWYTGYNEDISDIKYLGYATSKDGISWKRFSDKPIFSEKWTEDMQVVKYRDLYYMFAEGEGDITHLLTSADGISWQEQGDVSILKEDGTPIAVGPYGTPTVFIENDKKYLFYERNDEAVWLATSEDFKTWKNIRDTPVLDKGPEEYDAGAVAANQVIRFGSNYYMFYHGSSNPNWQDPNSNALWTSSVAISTDLVHWNKYKNNPIIEGDHSSAILVYDGTKYSLYAMHDKVWRYDLD